MLKTIRSKDLEASIRKPPAALADAAKSAAATAEEFVAAAPGLKKEYDFFRLHWQPRYRVAPAQQAQAEEQQKQRQHHRKGM